jgi:hypothetical protein
LNKPFAGLDGAPGFAFPDDAHEGKITDSYPYETTPVQISDSNAVPVLKPLKIAGF